MKGKKNAGFSLVELIVTVLIMAIIAVALAPQVIRWVENSRIASDLDTKNAIEKACQLAIANETVFEEVKQGGYTITVTKNSDGTTVTTDPSVGTEAFWDNFFKIAGYHDFNDFKDTIEIKSTPINAPEIKMVVYVYEDGHTFSELTGFSSAEIKVS